MLQRWRTLRASVPGPFLAALFLGEVVTWDTGLALVLVVATVFAARRAARVKPLTSE